MDMPMYAGPVNRDAQNLPFGYANWPTRHPATLVQDQGSVYNPWGGANSSPRPVNAVMVANGMAASQPPAHWGPLPVGPVMVECSKPLPEAVPLPFGFQQRTIGGDIVEGFASNESDSADSLRHDDNECSALDDLSTDLDSGSDTKTRPATCEAITKPKQKAAPTAIVGDVTTWMICNIPCCVTQEQLTESIDSLGFGETYDYLYLPVPNHNGSSKNLGYGFINFMDPSEGVHFVEAFQNFHFGETQSTKICEVRPARIQGLASNVRHLKRSLKKTLQAGQHIRRGGPFIRLAEPAPHEHGALTCNL